MISANFQSSDNSDVLPAWYKFVKRTTFSYFSISLISRPKLTNFQSYFPTPVCVNAVITYEITEKKLQQ